MWVLARSRVYPLALVLLLMAAGCDKAGEIPEIKKTGMFTLSGDTLVEIPRLGTMGNSYGPRLYPEIPDYNIPAMPDVGPIYVNIPDLSASRLKGSDGPKTASVSRSVEPLPMLFARV